MLALFSAVVSTIHTGDFRYMENFIPLIFIFVLVFLQIKNAKDLFKYLSSTYPDEWKKLAHNPLGGAQWSLTNENLAESLKTGFFPL